MAESHKIIYCTELPSGKDILRWKFRECSYYDDRNIPPLWAMREIAWTLATDKKGKQIGFLSPADFDAKRDQLAKRTAVRNPFTGDRDHEY